MLYPLNPFNLGGTLHDFTPILDNHSSSQFWMLHQHLSSLMASISTNIHKSHTITAHSAIKRHHTNPIGILAQPHRSLEVLQHVRILLEPGIELQFCPETLLERTAVWFILVPRLLEEVR